MRRLTRYFLTAYLGPLFASAGALVILVLMADLMERLDDFIAGKVPAKLAAEYLLALIPLRLTEILPVAAMLAALLSLGNLSRRKELVAAMSGGVHPWRCVRPILWVGFALSLLCLGMGEYVSPAASRITRKIWAENVRHLSFQRRVRYDNLTAAGTGGLFYSVGTLDTEKGRMEDVLVDRSEAGRPASQIRAATADWRKDRWVFSNGVVRTFKTDGVEISSQRKFASLEMKSRESPKDLVPPEENTESLGYQSLKRHIRRLKNLGVPTRELEVDLYGKLALPWANLIVLLLGIPFAFQKNDGKVKAVGFALGVSFFYFGLMQVGRALGQKPWCPPWLGSWMADMIFGVVGTWMFVRMRKPY